MNDKTVRMGSRVSLVGAGTKQTIAAGILNGSPTQL